MTERHADELQELSTGLDPCDIQSLIKYKPGDPAARPWLLELAGCVKHELRYSALSMIRGGRFLKAIRAQLNDNDWKEFVREQRWEWSWVWASMRFVEVVIRIPKAINLSGGRVVQRICHYRIEHMEQFLTELPEEAIAKLTPKDLEDAYAEHLQQTPEPRRPRRSRAPAKAHVMTAKQKVLDEEARADDAKYPGWTEFDKAYDGALYALRILEHCEVVELDHVRLETGAYADKFSAASAMAFENPYYEDTALGKAVRAACIALMRLAVVNRTERDQQKITDKRLALELSGISGDAFEAIFDPDHWDWKAD